MLRELMDSMPLWVVLILTIIAVLLAIELGYRTGLWRRTRIEFDSEALLSSMTGAHLALLAFILAFSFSMAAGHHSTRKQMILEEANAIGTAYLRASLVAPEQGDKIRLLLRDYTTLRAGIRDRSEAVRMIAESEALQDAMWLEIEVLAHKRGDDEMDALLAAAINSVIDVHERRVAAGLRNRVPPTLWVTLYSLLTLSMIGIGYFSGMKGARNPIASTGLALSFSLVLSMIADLDRPSSGLMMADRSAITDLQKRINR